MNHLRFIATVLLQIGNDIQEGRGKEHRSALRKMMKDLYMSKKDCNFARFSVKQNRYPQNTH